MRLGRRRPAPEPVTYEVYFFRCGGQGLRLARRPADHKQELESMLAAAKAKAHKVKDRFSRGELIVAYCNLSSDNERLSQRTAGVFAEVFGVRNIVQLEGLTPNTFLGALADMGAAGREVVIVASEPTITSVAGYFGPLDPLAGIKATIDSTPSAHGPYKVSVVPI